MWTTLNWSNTAGLYCFGEGILGFVTTGHFSVGVILAGQAGCCTRRSYHSRSRIAMTDVTNITRTNVLTAAGTLHYWNITVRLQKSQTLPSSQTFSGGHPASRTMGIGSLSRRYSGWGVALTTHPDVALRLKKQ